MEQLDRGRSPPQGHSEDLLRDCIQRLNHHDVEKSLRMGARPSLSVVEIFSGQPKMERTPRGGPGKLVLSRGLTLSSCPCHWETPGEGRVRDALPFPAPDPVVTVLGAKLPEGTPDPKSIRKGLPGGLSGQFHGSSGPDHPLSIPWVSQAIKRSYLWAFLPSS